MDFKFLNDLVDPGSPLGAVFYLFVGGWVGYQIAYAAARPRLSGSYLHQLGAAHDPVTWIVRIKNQPSFLGRARDGDTARDLYAVLRPVEKRGISHPLHWVGDAELDRVSIEPGKYRELKVLQSRSDTPGYSLVNHIGEPVRHYTDKQRDFVLVVFDRFERQTHIRFTAHYDDNAIERQNAITFEYPIRTNDRLLMLQKAWFYIRGALRWK